MKKFLTLMIVAAAAFVAAPKAEARPHHQGHTYVSGRSSCGCAVYSQRFIAYYDRCGHPVYSVRRLPVTHRCRSAAHYRPQYRSARNPYQNGYAYSRGRTYTSSNAHSYYSSRGQCR